LSRKRSKPRATEEASRFFDDFLGEIAKLADSSRLSSVSQKMSRLAL